MVLFLNWLKFAARHRKVKSRFLKILLTCLYGRFLYRVSQFFGKFLFGFDRSAGILDIIQRNMKIMFLFFAYIACFCQTGYLMKLATLYKMMLRRVVCMDEVAFKETFVCIYQNVMSMTMITVRPMGNSGSLNSK